jgi:hypothetical protein
MSSEKALDDLIEAGWRVIETDFEPEAFLSWRKQALDCVLVLVGPDHPYAKFFNAFLAKEARNSLLAGAGILEATREQVVARRSGPDPLDSAETNF